MIEEILGAKRISKSTTIALGIVNEKANTD